MNDLCQFHAVVVGISRYRQVEPLPVGVRRGAEEVAATLRAPSYGGFQPETVHLLTDGEATRDALLSTLSTVGVLAGPGGTVLLYFAGHGGRDVSGRVALWMVDADLSTPQRRQASTISSEDLEARIGALPVRRLVCIFDCCHAGGVLAASPQASDLDSTGGGVGTRRPVSGLPESVCQQLGASRGRVVMASARATERSWVTHSDRPSVFTRHLLAALRGGAVGEAGWLRVFSIFEHLQPLVTAERPDQHPVFKAELEENFPLLRYLGGQSDPRTPRAGSRPFHAYISYADDDEDDTRWVWTVLLPELQSAGLRIAISGDVEALGVSRVVGIERGIERAERTVVILSDAYLGDRAAAFLDTLAQSMGLEEGRARLIPVRRARLDASRLPARLRTLVSLDLSHPFRGERALARLIAALRSPAPVAS